jgi:hypothetical protein
MTTRRRTPARHNPGILTADRLPDLAAVVADLRPGWDAGLLLSILSAHRSAVPGAVLVRAALDAADDPDVVDPRAIGWALRRAQSSSVPVCAVCNLPADRCARRVGVDDDHEFTDKASLSPIAPGPRAAHEAGWAHWCEQIAREVRLPVASTSCRVCGAVRS